MLRYAITNRTNYSANETDWQAALVAQAARLAADGLDYIQLREKDLLPQHLIGTARQILSTIHEGRSGTKLLINSRADVAVAAGAHGVHLPSGDDQLSPGQIRKLFGARETTISVSCHNFDEVRRAEKSGADLILFGPVFGKSIAGELVVPETGLAALSAACELAGETPVLALGGITAANTAACIAAGAKGIAAIRLFR